MESLLRDVRFGIRTLAKNPGFTLAAVLTLALGIGANTAVFSVVNAYMLRPLPVRDPGEIVVAGQVTRELSLPHETSYPAIEDIRGLREVFAGMVPVMHGVANMSVGGQAERTWIEFVGGDYFSMLGVDAVRGRTFLPGEAASPGEGAVMVISHGYWQRRFGGDPAAVGAEVTVNGVPFTIVGVAPESFPGTEPLFSFEAYAPVTMVDRLYPGGPSSFTTRGLTGFRMVGRLRPGVSVDEAQAALDVLARRLEAEYPDAHRGVGFRLFLESRARPMVDVAGIFPIVAASFTALVALVLLIACANVANLTLARVPGRRREIAVRVALGAGRLRIVRQLLTESLLLSLAGGAAGLIVGQWATGWLGSIRFAFDAPFRLDFAFDWRIFAFAQGVALLTGVATGLVPALQATKVDLSETLKDGGRGASSGSGRHRLRGALVAAQVAVSLVLLVASGLFVRSLASAWSMELGFRTENLLLSSVDVGLQGYDEQRGRAFYRDLLERAKALPGVESAALVRHVPLGYSNTLADVYPSEPGSAALGPDEDHVVVFNTVVGLDYFRTMGTPLLEGRDFTERDGAGAPRVAVVNRAMAERFWPGEEPVGKRFRLERDGDEIEVVGVAATMQYLWLGETPRPFFYLPLAQNYRSEMTLVAHTARDPEAAAAAVREIVRGLDAELPVYDVKTMASHLRDGKALLFARLGAQLVGAFGLLGLALAVAGVYGVMSYAVSQRTHEIGVRIALGAMPRDVLRLVVRQGLGMVLAGVAVGLAVAVAATRFLSSLLYGVSPFDPVTFLAVPVLLAAVALLASYLPARRAARVDPIVALRYE